MTDDPDYIQAAIQAHEAVSHDSLLTRQEIEALDAKALVLIEEIADEILGPHRSALLYGGSRDTSQGIKANQKRLMEWQSEVSARLNNGGLPSKLTSKDRAAVVVAALSGATAVVLGVIDYFAKHAG